MRNALARVGKGAEMGVATIRTMVAQPTPDAIRHHVDADMLTAQFPAVTELLLDAKADLTACADLPHAHWRKIWSTNPLERLHQEVKRRTVPRKRGYPRSSGSFPIPTPCQGCRPAS